MWRGKNTKLRYLIIEWFLPGKRAYIKYVGGEETGWFLKVFQKNVVERTRHPRFL